MSTIAQKVAAELSAHQPLGWGCLCGGWSATQWHSFVDLAAQFREHAAAHIAEVTEAAVRAQAAADIEALTGRDPLADYGLEHAARAVRGGDHRG